MTLEWSWVAEHRDLLEIDWRAAGRICAALVQFAATGRGDVVRDTSSDPRTFRLRVPGAVAVFRASRETLFVKRVYPRR